MCWTESLSTPSSSDAEDDDTESLDYGDNDIKLEDPFSILSHELDTSPLSPNNDQMRLHHTRTTSLTTQSTKTVPAVVGTRRNVSDSMLQTNKDVFSCFSLYANLLDSYERSNWLSGDDFSTHDQD